MRLKSVQGLGEILRIDLALNLNKSFPGIEYSWAPMSYKPPKGKVFPKKSKPPLDAPKKGCKSAPASIAAEPAGNLYAVKLFKGAG